MKKGYNLANLGILAATAPLVPGRAAIANEAAFGNTFLSEPLTDYAVGWRSENNRLESLLEFMAPGVRSARRFEYRKSNNADAFAMIADNHDVRAMYGEFELVKTDGEVVQAKTVSKGLSTVMEKDSELPGDRERKVAWLKSLLLRAEIYRADSMLATTATNTNKTWNSSSTPDADVRAAILAFGNAVGVDANRVLFGSTAWQKRMGAYEAMDTKNFVPPATLVGLADYLGVDEVRKSTERYTSGSGKSQIVSASKVYVFNGTTGGSMEDSSTLKRFWSPKANGAEWVVYVDEITNPELVKITVAHNSQIAATVTAGVQSLTIS